MATDIGNLAVQVTGNTTGLAHSLKAGENMVQGWGKRVGSMGTALWSGIGSAGGMIAGMGIMSAGQSLFDGVFGFVKDSIMAAAEMEDVAASFRVMVGDAARGEALFRAIESAADDMRMSIQQTAEAGRDLLGAGIAEDQIVPTLRMLGDLALGDQEKLKGLARTYAQLREQGTITWKQLKSLPLGIGTELAKSLGVAKSELKHLADDGKVMFPDLQRAMVAATSKGGMFFEGTAERGKTLLGQIDQLKNAWDDFKWDLGAMLIEEFGLKEFVGDLTEALELGRDGLESWRPLIRDVANLTKEVARGAYQFVMAIGEGIAQFADFLDRNKGRFRWLTETPRDTFGGTAVGDAIGMDKADPGGRFEQKFNKMKEGLDAIFGTGAKTGEQIGKAAGAELVKAAGGIKIKIDKPELNDAQRKLLDGMRDEMDPMRSFKRDVAEFQKAMRIENLDPGNRDRGLLQFALGRIFAKHFPDGGQDNKLAAAAMKGSAEALSAIAQHQLGGGGQDVQARIAAAVEANKRAVEEHKTIGGKILDVLQQMAKGGGAKLKPLPN